MRSNAGLASSSAHALKHVQHLQPSVLLRAFRVPFLHLVPQHAELR